MIGRQRVLGFAWALLATSFATSVVVRAASLNGLGTPPEAATFRGLEDIHGRQEPGGAGTPSTFTEPGVGPGTEATLPLRAIDTGAPAADVRAAGTFWGLNVASGQWGLQMGARPRSIAGNAAPACWDGENRYVDCGNGTVMDVVTTLLWLKNADCFGEQDYAAANVAAARLADGACGLTDGSIAGEWRLPTKAEWEATIARAVVLGCRGPSLTNASGTGCFSVGPQPFTNVGDFYRSATAKEDIPGDAWGTDLDLGQVLNGGSKSNPGYVWPVRAGR